MKKKKATTKKAEAPQEATQRPFQKLKALASAKRKAQTPPQAPKRAAPSAPDSSSSDSETFARYMAGVAALEDKATRIPKTASRLERNKRDTPKTDVDAEARAKMRALVVEGIKFETVDDGDRLEGRRADVDPRELRKLRRGAHAIDGKLDLHGMSLDEARRAVDAFVAKRGADGDRVVLVVHGKGLHSPRGVAVLRGEIGAWLTTGRAARHVLAFTTASDEGSVLVLLAR